MFEGTYLISKYKSKRTVNLKPEMLFTLGGQNIAFRNTQAFGLNPSSASDAYIVGSELKDPIWHSSEWQIGSFSSEVTIYASLLIIVYDV